MADESRDKLLRSVYPLEIVDGRATVTDAGTAEALSSTSLIVTFVIITAETNNTGVQVVGASTVVAAVGTRRGTPLNAGDSLSLGGVDLNKVYHDSTVSGDGVTFLYLK